MLDAARQALVRVRDPRQLRARWLHVLSGAVDGYLRSPVFLVCMRYGLAATNEAQALTRSGFVLWPRALWRHSLSRSKAR